MLGCSAPTRLQRCASKYAKGAAIIACVHQLRSMACFRPTPSCHGTPMPRILPGTKKTVNAATLETETTTAATAAAKTGERQTNSFFLGLGSLIFGLLLVDNYLQYQNEMDAQTEINRLAEEEREQRAALFEKHKDETALFKVVAVIKYKMGGKMGLRDLDVGREMEVLQERVGPQQAYYLCRTRDQDGNPEAVGWYPMGFCKKLAGQEENSQRPNTTRRKKWLGLFDQH